jgi:hypothetical protein
VALQTRIRWTAIDWDAGIMYMLLRDYQVCLCFPLRSPKLFISWLAE